MKAAIKLFDSATSVTASDSGCVAVTGSHGGLYTAFLVSKYQVKAAAFSDAGVGFQKSGIAGLDYLEKIGIPAIAISHNSARIGDAQDTIQRGIVSYANAQAMGLGCHATQSCVDALERLRDASPAQEKGEPLQESRVLLRQSPIPVWGIDSASLVRPDDVGSIIVTGSHGGLVGGREENALKVDAVAAIYHDAGVGIDGAGITRLPALDKRGICAATVAANSAAIGDARSMWARGVISNVNNAAQEAGAEVGESVQHFVDCISKWVVANQPASQQVLSENL